MNANILILFLVFVLSVGAVLLVAWTRQGQARLEKRLGELSPRSERSARQRSGRLTRQALPLILSSLLPLRSDARTRLQRRMVQAGLFSHQSLVIYLGVKVVLLFAPWVVALFLGLAGVVPNMTHAMVGGAFGSAVGLIGPSFWLDRRVARRHGAIRRGLPDVLDVLVLCLEPGLSLTAAFQLVTAEVQSTYAELGFEMRVVQREIQLGRSLGQGLRSFAERSGLAEVGVLASTVEQTEMLGSSLVRSLRLQAEQLRFRRAQQAEERAQKAGGKILFPTMFLIFPSIFVILLGPAALQVQEVLKRRKAAEVPAATTGTAPVGRADLQPSSYRGAP